MSRFVEHAGSFIVIEHSARGADNQQRSSRRATRAHDRELSILRVRVHLSARALPACRDDPHDSRRRRTRHGRLVAAWPGSRTATFSTTPRATRVANATHRVSRPPNADKMVISRARREPCFGRIHPKTSERPLASSRRAAGSTMSSAILFAVARADLEVPQNPSTLSTRT